MAQENDLLLSGSEVLLHSLEEEGVKVIFGYPGGYVIDIYDALHTHQGNLRHILVRHEQGAIHAAQGYARVSGEVGVCFATSGPGATNLITGLADAMMDSTPLVCFTGQVGRHLLGTDAFQETDVVGISMPVTKWNAQVTDIEMLAPIIAKAFYIANTGRKGPVLIDFTKTAQLQKTKFHYQRCTSLRSYNPEPYISKTDIELAADAISQAQRPLALIGQGVTLGNAEEQTIAFLEKADMPFGWTILGKSAIPSTHPLNKGMLGMHGNYATNLKTQEADLIVAIGMRFDDRVTGSLSQYAKQAKIVHIEIDNAELNKNVKADYPILGNVKTVLPQLTEKIKPCIHTQWKESFLPLQQIEEKEIIANALSPKGKEITMGEVIHQISTITEGNAVLVTDVGQHQMESIRYFHADLPKSTVTSGGLGTMGFGLPAAIGAKIALPERQVILFVGDGGLQMTIQELGTIMAENIGVKIVLLNNQYLGMVRQWQELFFEERYSFTPMTNPDFQLIAKAYNITSQRVTQRSELQDAIKNMLKDSQAFLLEVNVKNDHLVFPMVPAGSSISDIRLK